MKCCTFKRLNAKGRYEVTAVIASFTDPVHIDKFDGGKVKSSIALTVKCRITVFHDYSLNLQQDR